MKSKQFLVKIAAAIAMLLPVVTASSCGSRSVKSGQAPPSSTRSPTTNETSTIALENLTGTGLSAVYFSPSNAAGWEENVLQSGVLTDGATADITFPNKALNSLWDLRVEGGRYSAEWRNVDLHNASRIVLVLKSAPNPVVIANVDERGRD